MLEARKKENEELEKQLEKDDGTIERRSGLCKVPYPPGEGGGLSSLLGKNIKL